MLGGAHDESASSAELAALRDEMRAAFADLRVQQRMLMEKQVALNSLVEQFVTGSLAAMPSPSGGVSGAFSAPSAHAAAVHSKEPPPHRFSAISRSFSSNGIAMGGGASATPRRRPHQQHQQHRKSAADPILDLLVATASSGVFEVTDLDGPAGEALALSVDEARRRKSSLARGLRGAADVDDAVSEDANSVDAPGGSGGNVDDVLEDQLTAVGVISTAGKESSNPLSGTDTSLPGKKASANESGFATSSADEAPVESLLQSDQGEGSSATGLAADGSQTLAKTARRRRRPQLEASADGSGALRSLGRDHWLVTAADIVYIILTTITIIWVISLLHPRTNDLEAFPTGATIGWLLFVELLTALFMVLTCFVRRRPTQWEVVDELHSIRRLYVRSPWFAIDLLCAAPIELVFLGWSNTTYNIVCTRHFLRIARVVPMHESTNPLLESRSWHPLLVIVMLLAVLGQVAAIIFLSLETVGDTQDRSVSLVDALYWASSSISSTGEGGVVGTTDQSRLFSIVVQFAGVLLLSLVTSFGTQFLTTKDPISEEFERRKQMMYAMLKFYDVPWTVQREIIALFPAVLASQNEESFREMVGGLPTNIAEKIEQFLKEKLLRGFPLFAAISEPTRADVVASVAKSLKRRLFAPFETVLQAGEIGNEMFFIVRGALDVSVPVGDDEEIYVTTLKSGEWFGEIALSERTRRTATIMTITAAELMELSRGDFEETVGRFPELKARLDKRSAEAKSETAEIIKSFERRRAAVSASATANNGTADAELVAQLSTAFTRHSTAAVFARNAQSAVFAPLHQQAQQHLRDDK